MAQWPTILSSARAEIVELVRYDFAVHSGQPMVFNGSVVWWMQCACAVWWLVALEFSRWQSASWQMTARLSRHFGIHGLVSSQVLVQSMEFSQFYTKYMQFGELQILFNQNKSAIVDQDFHVLGPLWGQLTH